jgi:predicted ABC-type ATPase
MPFLHILGGANGAGKSTYYDAAVKTGEIDPGLPFLNVDNVAKIEFGGYSPKSTLAAEEVVRQRMSELLKENQSFIIESNLAKSSEYEWLEKLAKKGYDLTLDFLSLGNTAINKYRVHNRVIQGGHDVPDHIIEQRSAMGISYLKAKIFIFKFARFIDNSQEQFKDVALTEFGKIVKMNHDCPQWAKDILYIAQRLGEKKGNTLNEPESAYHSRLRKGRKH